MSETTSTLPAPKNLSTSQVDQLRETLFSDDKASLKGRSVLIPFTKQAFFVGELNPSTNEKGEEQVRVVADQSQVQTVSTTEAKKWLEQNSSKSTKKNSSSGILKSQSKQVSENPTSSDPPPSPSSFGGFVEIQEEFNSDGTQVRGDVVDVSQRLKALWKNSMDPQLPQYQGKEADIILEEEETKKPPMSDEEYSKLSSRLDELARLEEQAETQGLDPSSLLRPKKPKFMAAKPSSKKSANSGWKKGFLTSNTKKTKTPKPKPEPSPQPSVTTPSVSTSEDTNKGVSFDTTQNQVQEIPRIGTQKVPPKPTTASPKPLESSMFSGVVQERPVIQERPLIRERPLISERPVPTSQTSTGTQPKKRMSRFARERQQHQ